MSMNHITGIRSILAAMETSITCHDDEPLVLVEAGMVDITAHLDALEQHLDALEQQLADRDARIGRLQRAFQRAETRLELWEANLDQSIEIWLAKWDLHDGDLA